MPGNQGEKSRGGKKSHVVTVDDALIDHAGRMWESERENAARIQEGVSLTAGAIVALLGLGLFSFLWIFQEPSHPIMVPWLMAFVHVCLILGLLSFAVAMGRLYSGPMASGAATELLEIDRTDLGSPVKIVVFRRTYRAYLHLKARNAEHRLRLKRGRVMFVGGMVFVFLAVLLYLGGSMPAKMYPEAVEHDPYHQSSEQPKPRPAGSNPTGDAARTG